MQPIYSFEILFFNITTPGTQDAFNHLGATITRKWILLFVNGSECKCPISTDREFLNSCPDG
jgi:hypothetical protein